MATFQDIFGPQGFACNSVDPTDDFLIPGDYSCLIVESEIRPNKKQNGHYLALVLQVAQEGEYKNHRLYDYINIQNPNKTAEQIAQKSLSALGRATNIWEITHPQQLLNQIVIAVVTKNDSGNNIRTYKPVGQLQGAVAAPAATQTAPPAPTVPQTVAPPASAAPVYQVKPGQPQVAAPTYQPEGQPSVVLPPAPVVQPPAPAVQPTTQAEAPAPTAVAGVPIWQQQQ